MAKLRSLSTAFWSDPFVEDLSPSEKLLFIYLITNEKTNMLGIYESSIKKMSFETGINKPDIEKALKGFETLKKVKYTNNYVILINYLKHQNFNTNMKKSAIDVYNSLPIELRDKDLNISKTNPIEGFERLSKALGMVRKVEDEREVEDEEEREDEDLGAQTPTIDERKISFKTSINQYVISNAKYNNKDELLNFFEYWTEHGDNDKKMRFEKEKSFGIGRRLGTWFKNNKYNNGTYKQNNRITGTSRQSEAESNLLRKAEEFSRGQSPTS